MKTLDKFESGERIVKLSYNKFDNTYIVTLFASGGRSIGKIYKSLFYARIKFVDYKSIPLARVKF